MQIHTRPQLHRDNLTDANDVQHALEALEHDLAVSEFAALQNFNKRYLIITRNVRQALK